MRSRILSMTLLIVFLALGSFFVWHVWLAKKGNNTAALGASFYPIAFLLERLSGQAVYQVTPPGVEPHDFNASPQAIIALQSMDLFVYNGAHLDAWAERIAPQLITSGVKVINLAESLYDRGIALRTVQEAEEEHEDSVIEEEHELVPGSTDPHMWLDPVLITEQAHLISETLIALHPDQRSDYEANLRNLLADLQALDLEYVQGLASCRVRTIVSSHDAFGYLSSRYRFTVLPLAGISPEQEPSARRIGELATLMREQGISYVFFETLVSPKLAETLANEAGAQTRVLNPIEGLTADDRASGEDYLSLMRKNLTELRTAMDCR